MFGIFLPLVNGSSMARTNRSLSAIVENDHKPISVSLRGAWFRLILLFMVIF